MNKNIRNTKITDNYLMHPDASILIETGNTKVICTATIENKVPRFLKDSGKGWVTAEYSMLPGSTGSRKRRERKSVSGRTKEIQRLIGRSLRSVVDLEKLGENSILIDCDVIQADGGTRTASITGGFIVLLKALQKMQSDGLIEEIPVNEYLAAVSIGIVQENVVLDLCYEEDSTAQVDLNLVMTESGKIIELQGTGEESPFTRDQLNQMIDLGTTGINHLIAEQKKIVNL